MEINVTGSKRRAVNNKAIVDVIKSVAACQCGDSDPQRLVFHHLHPADKVANISAMMTSCSQGRLIRELKKCKIMCSRCHRRLHFAKKHGLDFDERNGTAIGWEPVVERLREEREAIAEAGYE